MKHPKSVTGSPHPTASPVSLLFAIPDHPWVDNANGAAVRIAMTVGVRSGDAPFYGSDPNAPFYGDDLDAPFFGANGRLLTVVDERTAEFGEVAVTLSEKSGVIHADLSIGANVASAVALQSNAEISSPGVKLHGAGFIVSPAEAEMLGLGSVPGLERHIREYRNGRDLTASPRGVLVIDLFGLDAEQVRARFPAVYQWVMERVKPERDASPDTELRGKWWLFRRTNRLMRTALAGLPRYIATVETAKHRTFQFLDASILPDNKLIAIGLGDAFRLGVLSSDMHMAWALAAGSTLEDRPVYVKTTCFETFPFPDDDTGLTPELRERIAALAEQIDAHRKRVLSPDTTAPSHSAPALAHRNKGLTLTGLYNVLEALREGRVLTDKEKAIHQAGLVGVLKELHDELDAAVLAAYGWSDLDGALAGVSDGATSAGDARDTAHQELLARLVALNGQRAAEERQGRIRWLRPDFQDPTRRAALASASSGEAAAPALQQAKLELGQMPPAAAAPDRASAKAGKTETQPWPSTLPEQVRAVVNVLSIAPLALPLPAIEAHFKGRGSWKKSLPRILETLEALGRARSADGAWRE